MKPLRLNKVIGLAIGERSLLAAEITAGDRPDVKRLVEFVYPEGITTAQPAELGAALGEFLKENKFTARAVVVGLPARWLVVKAKEVPPADPVTLAAMLRLQAEGEFSSELKELVFDYTADTTAGNPRSVLLIATPRKYIDAATQLCDAAKLNAVIVTSSAVALGAMTGQSANAKNPLVLLVTSAGAELTAQSGGVSNAIRYLRGPGTDRPFVGELRRAISGMPASSGATNGSPRELFLWDAAGEGWADSGSLGTTLGIPVRSGDLPILGVTSSEAGLNGESRKYAAAVALGLLGLADGKGQVDFLHSRLAPVPKPLIPRWAYAAAAGVLVLIALICWAISDMHTRQAQLDKLVAENDGRQSQVKDADAFVTKVSFAQAWHLGNPRYLYCMTDITNAIPQDGQTYALSLTIHENVPAVGNTAAAQAAAIKASANRTLSGRLDGKTTDQLSVQRVIDHLKAKPKSFADVKLSGTQDGGRNREVSFGITFTYLPPVAPPVAVPVATPVAPRVTH